LTFFAAGVFAGTRTLIYAGNLMTLVSAINDTTCFVRANDLVATEIDGEVVILGVESSSFYNLNRVGSRIWDMLDTPKTMPEICAALMARFNVTVADCQAEVRAFIERMLDQGLLETA
jgi:hypothetical protein